MGKQFTVAFRPLPWVKDPGGNWIADIRPFFYRVARYQGLYEMHDENGRVIRGEDGKPVKRVFDGWLSWPYCPHERRQLGPGEHPCSVPYVAAKTAEECMELVNKVHHRKIGKHLELIGA